jgi:membrane-bound lytic murein transglycosylase B
MSGMAGIVSVAAIQARIGQIEQRLGVRRPLPVDTASTSASIAGRNANASAASTTSTASAASVSAALAVDPSASITDLLGADPSTSGTTFDRVFEAAVAELRSQWDQSSLSPSMPTGATGATGVVGVVGSGTVTSPAVTGTSSTSGTPGVDGAVSPGTPYASLFEEVGARYGIPPKVLAAIGYVESRFRTDAVSSAGAVGMMQFLPSTAASMGVDPGDPASAIDGTGRYLRSALDRFGSLEQAIASYNVGPGAIARAGGVQPGSQAERYLTKVLDATGRI